MSNIKTHLCAMHTIPHRLLSCIVFVALFTGCGTGSGTDDPDPNIDLARGRGIVKNLPKVKFRDITQQAGITFRHTNGAFGKKLLPETMGSGVAFLDYDNDNKQDLLFINSCHWPGLQPKGKDAPTFALYRNLGNGQFQDVTQQVNLAVSLYGMGVTAGDIDNDGYIDLFVTAVGGNRLYHNQPHGKDRRFVDITAKSPDLAPTGAWQTTGNFLERQEPLDFPSSAAFFDYNNDGRLDLFVCNYVTWSPGYDLSQKFNLKGHGRGYGPPKAFSGTFCQLFENRNGRFVDVSREKGIQVTGELTARVGKSLGVIVCDPDGDGWQDIIVANDTVRNFFFHNQSDGQGGRTYYERGRLYSVAYAKGTPRGAMGIDWGEYRAGKHGVVIGNYANEPNTLLSLDFPKRLQFSDVAMTEGVGGPSRIMLVFGLFYFDFDLDGRLDILTCNGHIEPDIGLVSPEQDYAQSVQMFWNTGNPRIKNYVPLTAKEMGRDLFVPLVGRGCAYADIDGDGDLDVVMTANNGPARLLRNEGGTEHHWVRFRLHGDGKTTNRSAIGARVRVTAGGQVRTQQVTSGRGYLSQSDLAVTFGLGKATRIERVEIFWPGGGSEPQVLTNMEVDREHHVVQGQTETD